MDPGRRSVRVRPIHGFPRDRLRQRDVGRHGNADEDARAEAQRKVRPDQVRGAGLVLHGVWGEDAGAARVEARSSGWPTATTGTPRVSSTSRVLGTSRIAFDLRRPRPPVCGRARRRRRRCRTMSSPPRWRGGRRRSRRSRTSGCPQRGPRSSSPRRSSRPSHLPRSQAQARVARPSAPCPGAPWRGPGGSRRPGRSGSGHPDRHRRGNGAGLADRGLGRGGDLEVRRVRRGCR